MKRQKNRVSIPVRGTQSTAAGGARKAKPHGAYAPCSTACFLNGGSLRLSAPAAYGLARYSEDSPDLETVYETSISLLPFFACTTRIALFQKKSREKITVSPGKGPFYLCVSYIVLEYFLCNAYKFLFGASWVNPSDLMEPGIPLILTAVGLEPGIAL